MSCKDFATYEDYCETRRAAGLQVVSRSLFNALKMSQAKAAWVKG